MQNKNTTKRAVQCHVHAIVTTLNMSNDNNIWTYIYLQKSKYSIDNGIFARIHHYVAVAVLVLMVSSKEGGSSKL